MSAILDYSKKIEDDGKIELGQITSEVNQRGYQIDLISKPSYFAVRTTDVKHPTEVENDFEGLENVRVVVACREPYAAESLLQRSL